MDTVQQNLAEINDTEMTNSSISDPAADLLELCYILQSFAGSSSGSPQRVVLAEVFSAESNSAEYFEIMAAIKRRFEDLRISVENDTAISQNIRARSITALLHLSSFLNTEQSQATWNAIRETTFRPEYLTALEFLSEIIRPRMPLKRLADEERQAVSNQLNELIAELKGGRTGLEQFIIDALVDSFNRLILVVTKFPFFGHSELRNRLALTKFIISAVEHETSTKAAIKLPIINKAKIVISVIAAMIFVSDADLAIENLYDKSKMMIEYIMENNTPEVKALPAPNFVENNSSSPESSPKANPNTGLTHIT